MNKKYYHRILEQYGVFTEACAVMQKTNGDRYSIFLEFGAEIWEVTKALLDNFNEEDIL